MAALLAYPRAGEEDSGGRKHLEVLLAGQLANGRQLREAVQAMYDTPSRHNLLAMAHVHLIQEVVHQMHRRPPGGQAFVTGERHPGRPTRTRRGAAE
jgi:hypothetical protein